MLRCEELTRTYVSGGRPLTVLKDITFDAELVTKKWGVPPHQFVDLLALMGDKIDNIPGVPGIGQKGAATLLARYGSLDAILAHLEELPARQRGHGGRIEAARQPRPHFAVAHAPADG